MSIHNPKLVIAFGVIALTAFSCFVSGKTFDRPVAGFSPERAEAIKKLAEFAIVYTIDKKEKKFRTDTLPNSKVRREFNRQGLTGTVIVTYGNNNYDIGTGIIDSTVIFKQISFKAVTEIIYDFSAYKKEFPDDKSNPQQYIFVKVADRIYYRIRQVPLM